MSRLSETRIYEPQGLAGKRIGNSKGTTNQGRLEGSTPHSAQRHGVDEWMIPKHVFVMPSTVLQ